MMSWRGSWAASQQYFLNDVAVSPANFGSYILSGVTSTTSDVDPSLDPSWIELSGASTAVNNISAGNGITLSGTATNPVIINSGVLTLGVGAGLINTSGDPQNPTIANDGVISIVAGTGINVDNTNPQIPVISNTGLTRVIAGVGIDIPLFVVGTPPIINNTGVLSLTAGNNITITGGTTATISANSGTSSYCGSPFAVTSPSPIPAAGTGTINFSPAMIGVLADYLANGAPDATGAFLINMSGFNFYFGATSGSPVLPNNVVNIAFKDTTTNTTYSAGGAMILTASAIYPVNATMPLLYFNVANARTAGLRAVNQIVLTNTTGSVVTMTTTSAGPIAIYYPNGLQ